MWLFAVIGRAGFPHLAEATACKSKEQAVEAALEYMAGDVCGILLDTMPDGTTWEELREQLLTDSCYSFDLGDDNITTIAISELQQY